MLDYPDSPLFIGGLDRQTPETLPVINPATESQIGRVAVAGESDLSDAVAVASRGFQSWRQVSPDRRCEVLMSAAALIRERVDSLASILTLEQGKPIRESRAEILRACDIIDWDAQESRRLYGRVVPYGGRLSMTVLREPIGVVAAFSPWNFPFGSPCRKVSAALAAGCAVVLKPSEEAPASGVNLAKAFVDAGVPPEAISVVFGRPAQIARDLLRRTEVRMVAFTGSIPVGKSIAGLAAASMKPALLELGGHAPVIVCSDADPVNVATEAVRTKVRSSGQICTAPTRFFVHRDIYPSFLAAFCEASRSVRIGDGFDEGTTMGPLVNRGRVDAVDRMVQDAVARGARLMVGGCRPKGPGCFYPLTLLADVPESALAMNEEPFGPIALASSFDELGDAIASANALPYGLAAYAFTGSVRTAAELAGAIECGNLSINHFGTSVPQTPLGGVKESGYGREGGTEGLLQYTIAKCVSQLN